MAKELGGIYAEIRNCEFKFQCPRTWESLALTKVHEVRYCNSCEKEVFFCTTAAELRSAIVADRCVAIEIPRGRRSPDVLLGMIDKIELK
jgi:hypothetical protein